MRAGFRNVMVLAEPVAAETLPVLNAAVEAALPPTGCPPQAAPQPAVAVDGEKALTTLRQLGNLLGRYDGEAAVVMDENREQLEVLPGTGAFAEIEPAPREYEFNSTLEAWDLNSPTGTTSSDRCRAFTVPTLSQIRIHTFVIPQVQVRDKKVPIGVGESRASASLLQVACQGGTRSPRRIPQSARHGCLRIGRSPCRPYHLPPKVPWRRSARLPGLSHFRQALGPLDIPSSSGLCTDATVEGLSRSRGPCARHFEGFGLHGRSDPACWTCQEKGARLRARSRCRVPWP